MRQTELVYLLSLSFQCNCFCTQTFYWNFFYLVYSVDHLHIDSFFQDREFLFSSQALFPGKQFEIQNEIADQVTWILNVQKNEFIS